MINVGRGEKVRLFNTVTIESSGVCNRTCVFCPNHKFERPDVFMPWNLIEKAIDELAALNYHGQFNTFMYNEPMRDERIFDIAQIFRNRVPRGTFMVSTNGDYLRGPETMTKLFESGVKNLHINVYSQWDNDPERRDKGIEIAEKRLTQLDSWIDQVPGAKRDRAIYSTAPAGTRRVFLDKKFGKRNEDRKMGAKFVMQNRAGTLDWVRPPTPQPLKKMCVRPFRKLEVNYNGDMLLCCDDYHGVSKYANLATSTLVEGWNSIVMNTYRLMLQNKKRDINLCKTCDYFGGYYQHMVDEVTFGADNDERLLSMSGDDALVAAKDLC